MNVNRRNLLKQIALGSTALAVSQLPFTSVFAGESYHHTDKGIAPGDAIKLLQEGNARYAAMQRLGDPGVGPRVRQPLLKGQWPYATILSCSDSRVPPELIFDEGLGRLFIVRDAGNFIDANLLGSIEYATLHSTSRLIMVMGHESCGAIGAAVNAFEHPELEETSGIESIITNLLPAVMRAKKETGFSGSQLVEAAAKKNVEMNVQEIAKQSNALRKMQMNGELKIVGAYYSLQTGKVDIWV